MTQKDFPLYIHRFLKQVDSFIQKYNLFTKDAALLVTVSGGIDSMVMLQTLKLLDSFGYSLRLRVLHINHGTRSEQKHEAKMVEDFSQFLGIEFSSLQLEGLNPHKNFEYRARQKRYETFYEHARGDEKIVLAHHIDDSFEWSMLQSLRSSSLEGLVGIPLVNHRVIRPFLCVTKRQITQFADMLDTPFLEDPTNEQIKYERNYLRQEVIPAFSQRHPQYLKHYVNRHNELARRLGLHWIDKESTSFHMSYGKSSVLIYNFTNTQDFSGVESLLLKGLNHLSPHSRSSLNQQLLRVKDALANHKLGPLNLSGKYKAYLDYNLILLTANRPPKLCFKYKDFKTFSFDEFRNQLEEQLAEQNHLAFPFVVFVKNHYIDKRQFNTSFNMKRIKSFCGVESSYYPALRLLREWSKKRNRHRVLRLNFLTAV